MLIILLFYLIVVTDAVWVNHRINTIELFQPMATNGPMSNEIISLSSSSSSSQSQSSTQPISMDTHHDQQYGALDEIVDEGLDSDSLTTTSSNTSANNLSTDDAPTVASDLTPSTSTSNHTMIASLIQSIRISWIMMLQSWQSSESITTQTQTLPSSAQPIDTMMTSSPSSQNTTSSLIDDSYDDSQAGPNDADIIWRNDLEMHSTETGTESGMEMESNESTSTDHESMDYPLSDIVPYDITSNQIIQHAQPEVESYDVSPTTQMTATNVIPMTSTTVMNYDSTPMSSYDIESQQLEQQPSQDTIITICSQITTQLQYTRYWLCFVSGIFIGLIVIMIKMEYERMDQENEQSQSQQPQQQTSNDKHEDTIKSQHHDELRQPLMSNEDVV